MANRLVRRAAAGRAGRVAATQAKYPTKEFTCFEVVEVDEERCVADTEIDSEVEVYMRVRLY